MSRQHIRRAFTLTDVCVGLCVLALVIAALVPAVRKAGNGSSRIKCASNLRQIGQSMQIYANENKGVFPRTIFDGLPQPVPTEYTGVNAPDPFGPGGPGPNDVSAGLYLLLRSGDITSEVFVCPVMNGAVGITRWNPPGAPINSFSNFPSRAHLTYGYTNPYPSQAARNLKFKLNWTLNSDFAIAADMGTGPVVATTPANASRKQMIAANSPNHGGDGQNVLYADGHVDWSPTIFCGSPRPTTGAPRDNIYAYGVDSNVTTPSAGTHGAPQDQHDSVILPTADLGPQPGPLPPRVNTPLLARRETWFILLGVAFVIGASALVIFLGVKPKRGPSSAGPVAPQS